MFVIRHLFPEIPDEVPEKFVTTEFLFADCAFLPKGPRLPGCFAWTKRHALAKAGG
jgi:hypothetical protein